MLGAAKHQIERAWRFTDNDRVETADAMRPIIQRLLKRRKAKLLVALDWVDVTGFQTLMASAVLRGRPFDSAQVRVSPSGLTGSCWCWRSRPSP